MTRIPLQGEDDFELHNPMDATNTAKTIRLLDGRALGYAEYGDPNGKPVVYFHGLPGSRLQAQYLDAAAAHLGARVIAPERPGCGLSDFKPKRKLLDWSQDVLALADKLQIDRFAVMGVSGGGPYAAVCAHQILERVTKAVFVAATSPMNVPNATDGMFLQNRLLFGAARFAPWLLPVMFNGMARGKNNPDAFINQASQRLAEVDRAILQRDNRWSFLLADMNEAFRNGVQGAVWDTVLLARPWGFRLEEICVPTFLWQGEKDKNVPIAMGRYLASNLPSCQATFVPEAGHLSLIIGYAEPTINAAIS